MKKKIPKFKAEDEERAFWATHDSTEYVDWKKARKVDAWDIQIRQDVLAGKLDKLGKEAMAARKKIKL